MPKLTLASLFAGIGGIDLGFKKAGVKPIWANEIDKYCAITFRKNHPNTTLIVDDISNIKGKDIPKVDILTAGFPCQPFSVAGYQKGFKDDRGNMFFQIIRLIEEMTYKPRIIFLENVKNLKNHDKGNTFKMIQQKLEEIGYYVTEKILNTCEYANVPQNRERIFIIGFLEKKDFQKFDWLNIKKQKLTKTIDKVIDWNDIVSNKYLYQENQKCFNLLKENVTEKNTIYQYRRIYVRKNKNKVCPTLTANMGMGGHNVPIILDNYGNIRKLTPKECLLLQSFPKDFVLPDELCDSRIYKQIGNAVSVKLIEIIAKEILRVVEE